MNLTTKAWTDYITRLARLNEKAGQLMADYLASHGTADTEALIAYASALVMKYGEGSAELACQMYDAMAALQKAGVPAAVPAEPAARNEVARMVQATKDSQPRMRQGVSRMVKQAAADTTVKNALRDGAEWAWVPHGDTCPFCLTLASRGWQKASSTVLKGGHAEHIHANCDCEFAVRFDGRTGVAGYDPDKYLAQYNAAGGDLNKLRRINYAANKDRINAQKRAAYAARLENRNKAAIIGLSNDKFTIDEPKISQFLLKPGAKHSQDFFGAGYTEQDAQKLVDDIYQRFDESQKTDIRIAEDGTESFSVFMDLGISEQKRFRTVWRKDNDSKAPRFITAHREDEKK